MIAIENLHYRYPRAREAVFEGLDLSLPAGSICGMLGPNGAGKSTLLKLMAGLLFPHQGKCRVLDHRSREREPSFLAELFLLPEEIQMPPLRPSAYLKRYAGFYPRFDRDKFDALMAEFELPAGKKASDYSHGQKKKFMLAFGIACGTRLLVMDEPTNGLDIPSKSQFRRVLIEHFEEERSFIISTHQVHDLVGLIDAVAIIAGGKLLLNAPLEQLAGRLAFSTEPEDPDDALYSERALEGFSVIRKNEAGQETPLDLGLLFNLATRRPQVLREALSEGGQR